jgi:hypothetical protein
VRCCGADRGRGFQKLHVTQLACPCRNRHGTSGVLDHQTATSVLGHLCAAPPSCSGRAVCNGRNHGFRLWSPLWHWSLASATCTLTPRCHPLPRNRLKTAISPAKPQTLIRGWPTWTQRRERTMSASCAKLLRWCIASSTPHTKHDMADSLF